MNGTSRYREAANRRCFITILHWNQDSAMRVDLHCHSTASDGVLAPAALVQRAHEKGVGLLALTDHDTLEGLPEAHQAAARLGIELVNGVELSCTWVAPPSMCWATVSTSTPLPCARPPKPCTALGARRGNRPTAGGQGYARALEGARAIQRALGDSGNAGAAAFRRVPGPGRLGRIAPTRSASGWGRQAGRRQAALADPGGSGRLPARGARLDQPGAPVPL